MNQTVEQLRKILELEQSKGYCDRAVVGGLDRFLHRLTPPSSNLANLLSLSYATLDAEERERWVREVLGLLADNGQESVREKPPAGRARRGPSPPPEGTHPPIDLDAPITAIRGIQSNLAAKFRRLGVETVRDFLYFFPHRHIDYSQMKPISQLVEGSYQTVAATVWEAAERKTWNRKKATEAIVGDESGNIRVVWFNQPYLAKKLTPNSRVVLSGRVGVFKGRKVFQSPEWELLDSDDLIHTGRLVPVYHLTAGLSPRVVRRHAKATVDRYARVLSDFLPDTIREESRLLSLSEAVRQAHYPDNHHMKDQARRRLAFDELFLIQLGVLSKKRDWQEEGISRAFNVDGGKLEPFLGSLPFSLTSAQKRTLGEIRTDLAGTRPMSRLLQGDVGSGKTVVAAAAMLIAAANGDQAALMAPTEILAEQHFRSLCQLLGAAPEEIEDGTVVRSFDSLLPGRVTVGLLTGGLRERPRQEILARIASGEINMAVGTHALIQKGVEFERLGLCVVDEQHRFGVMQRSELRCKGLNPHALVMSATPIPRTLALTLYGDLDLSIIDELPPGRTEIKTKWLSPNQRQKAYDFVRKQVADGRQAFIICPLIEESEAIETKAAVAEYDRLSRDVFPDLRLGLLHGRLSSREKDEGMQSFRDGGLDILVSTPVVEVGVDVPNATVMLIEGADRFGLAQLHQFRGRVGRGEHQSYCLLLADTPSPEARERLSLLQRTQDGFALAEQDLRLRGPGEFFGTRQTGLPELKMARLSDTELLELARDQAVELFEGDPYLSRPDHALLGAEVRRLWDSGGEPD